MALTLTLTSTIPLKNIGLRVVGGLEFRKGLKTKWVSDYRSRRDDSNGPRIVKIGAILPYFWPRQFWFDAFWRKCVLVCGLKQAEWRIKRHKNFGNYSWHRCDSNSPNIVKIGAILAIFRPFKDFRVFYFWWVVSWRWCLRFWWKVMIRQKDEEDEKSQTKAAVSASLRTNNCILIG